MTEGLFWDDLIQNNLVRSSPSEIDSMEPGIIFALKGIWQGRAKWLQENAPKKKKPKEPRKRNAAGS